MNNFYWSIDFDNYYLEDAFIYEVEGWAVASSGARINLYVQTDGDYAPRFKIKRKNRPDLKGVLKTLKIPDDAGFTAVVENVLELRDHGCTYLEITAETASEREVIFRRNIEEILKEGELTTLKGNLDIQEKKDGKMLLWGWVYDKYAKEKIEVLDSNGKPIPCKIKREIRNDVNLLFHLKKDRKCGFIISIERAQISTSDIVIRLSNRLACEDFKISLKRFDRENTKVGKFFKVLGPGRWRENHKRIKETGFKDFRYYAIKEMDHHVSDYDIWMSDNRISEKELDKQRNHKFTYNPKISIVIPLYNTPLNFLSELILSIQNQTYPNWELCLADGSDNGQVGPYIHKYYGQEKRITYRVLESNDGISENTNRAIEIATGDFIMFSDHDDTVAPNALYEIVKSLNEDLITDVVYTDEDKVTMDGKTYYDPHFKPDFNLDLLRSNNYICHIFVVKKSIVDQVGLLRKKYDGAQDYDFILRCCELAERIKHIPKVLYHWRNHPASTAGDPTSKMYAYEAGRAAVEDHFRRIGIKAEVTMTDQFGRYRTRLLPEGEPLISIIIPNKDHKKDLKRCLESIYSKSTYKNFEILIIENNSQAKDIFKYYQEIEKKYSNLKILEWKKEFNYAAINNFGVTQAKGEYLVLLNNDIEVKTSDWMEEMLGYCQREDVGIVGTKLLFEDERIQHAGIIVGLGPSRTAGHLFYTFPADMFTYAGKTQSTQDLSAVTAACMMTKKSLYQKLNGMDEEFQVAFNDVDFCLRMREMRKLVVYHAFVELYHYESITRGYDDSWENVKRFARETKKFKKRWAHILKEGDPYYNPNLSYTRADCAIRS